MNHRWYYVTQVTIFHLQEKMISKHKKYEPAKYFASSQFYVEGRIDGFEFGAFQKLHFSVEPKLFVSQNFLNLNYRVERERKLKVRCRRRVVPIFSVSFSPAVDGQCEHQLAEASVLH